MIATGEGWVVLGGDCMDALAPLEPVDHIITDPPYGEEYHSKPRTQGSDGFVRDAEYGFDGLSSEMRTALSIEFARLSRRWTIVFSDPESAHEWRDAIVASGMRYCRKGIWIKLACAPGFSGDRPASGHEEISIAYAKCPGRPRWNGGGNRGVWTHPVVNVNHDREHTTQKPVPLMLELVSLFTDPGETILDPFAGSGTTGVACLRLGRKFIGIEKDPKYFALCCERLRAEENGQTLSLYRAKQVPMFPKAPKPETPT